MKVSTLEAIIKIFTIPLKALHNTWLKYQLIVFGFLILGISFTAAFFGSTIPSQLIGLQMWCGGCASVSFFGGIFLIGAAIVKIYESKNRYY